MLSENRNPFIAGLLNMVIPGYAYLYVENDRTRFIKTLIPGIFVFVGLLVLSSAVQNTRNYSLPQGLCTGVLLLLFFGTMFVVGQKTAQSHNNGVAKTTLYNSRRQAAHGSHEAQMDKLKTMRDDGLISDQEYLAKKNQK